jgi:fusicocca-2,10(14)-diene synthase/ophiobolin F synthase
MEYSNSHLVTPAWCDKTTAGICTNIPLRVHHNAELADRGALRAQKDWQQHFGALPPNFRGTMGPELNFTAALLPETLPDRLEHVAYILEVAFLADDVIDAAESPMAAVSPHIVDLMQAYRVVKAGGDMDTTSCSPAATKIVDFARAMVAVDPGRANQAFRWLVKWMKMCRSAPNHNSNSWQNFDEYLEYRRLNVSSQYVPEFSSLLPFLFFHTSCLLKLTE